MDSRDQGTIQANILVDERSYWPEGVKLDSKISDDSKHHVIWHILWDDVGHFFSADYYAHDLYMDKDGGTFLDKDSLILDSTLPLTQRYRTSDGDARLRLGWAHLSSG